MDKPLVMFIEETKCSKENVKALGVKLWKGSELIVIDTIGSTRGICIILNPLEINLPNILVTRFTI